jgi:hypothetical protein
MVAHAAARRTLASVSRAGQAAMPVLVSWELLDRPCRKGPPGRAIVAAKFSPSGSDTEMKTIGIVRVSAISALTGSVLLARSTSGFNATNSLASAGKAIGSPAAKR